MGQAESSFTQACEAYDRGQFEDAADLLRETIDANPEHLDAKVNLGECRSGQDRQPGAGAARKIDCVLIL